MVVVCVMHPLPSIPNSRVGEIGIVVSFCSNELYLIVTLCRDFGMVCMHYF